MFVSDKQDRSARGCKAIDLAWDDQPLKGGTQRNEVDIDGRQTLRKFFAGLVGLEADSLETALVNLLAKGLEQDSASDQKPEDLGATRPDPFSIRLGGGDRLQQRRVLVSATEVAGIAGDELKLGTKQTSPRLNGAPINLARNGCHP